VLYRSMKHTNKLMMMNGSKRAPGGLLTEK
jgi:hypothetical protein